MMRNMKKLAVVLVLTLLAGCANLPPGAEATRLFGDYCEREAGHERGSIAYNRCVNNIAEKR